MSTATHSATETELVVLAIEDLKVDRTYQRRYSPLLVKQLEAQGPWDLEKAGLALINKRQSGLLYIIDGQHRVAYAHQSGESEILAELTTGKTVAQEAALRVARHTRKADTGYERFSAKLAQGDIDSVKIREIVEFNDGQIADGDGNGGIRAIGTLEKIYVRDGGDRLNDILGVLHDAFGRLHADNVTAHTLLSLDWLFTKNGHALDTKKLVRILQQPNMLEQIDGKARAMKAGSGGSIWRNYYRALVDRYNWRAPEHTRIGVVEF